MEASPRINPDYLVNVHAERARSNDQQSQPDLDNQGHELEIISWDGTRRVLSDVQLVGLTSQSIWAEAFKRTFDVLLALTLFILLSPVYLAAAIAVKVTTPGPVLFGQARAGRAGTDFRMYKFRSMVVDAEARLHEVAALAREGALAITDAPAFKSADDPRITRVGAWLRRTNIDELPQLINILRGDMTFVGPRPLVAAEVAVLPPAVASLRHSVRPGLTCKWQVERLTTTTFEQRMNLDLDYVRQRSTTLDMKLLLLTPIAVLRGEGSH